MARFSVGDKVIVEDTGARGVIQEVFSARRGKQLYHIIFPDGEGDEFESDIKADFDSSNPYDCCKSGVFGSYADFSKMNTTFKIQNSNNSTISSLKASKTLFRPYQFKPLLKFLNSPTRRILVADEVGLGKTIEAGHIMLELKARKELKNVLVICPKSLQHKWKAELFEKFGLNFKIYTSTKELIDDLSLRSDNVRAIINYERIRLKENDDDKRSVKNKKNEANLIDYLSNNECSFSLVLCDEAHKLRNSRTQTYKGAEIIMRNAEAAVFLTATPIMISEENLYNLLHLLDSRRYFNYQIFKNRIEENKPFVEALTMLNNNMPLHEIKDHLLFTNIKNIYFNSNEEEIYSFSSSISESFKNDPMFQEIIRLLGHEDSHELRARLQYLISSMSVMNTVFSRTRKREVTRDMSQAEREPHIVKVILYDDERIEFDKVIEDYRDDNSYTDDWGEEKLTQGGALGLVTKKRQVASSVWAYLNTESDLDKGIDRYEECQDAKIDMLIKIIKDVFAGGTKKLVIFALYRKTLKYLELRLKKYGYNSLVIHGQVNSEDRNNVLNRFKNDDDTHILLSSEVGSEGLDMQFCNSMVNYDLPWNPMVVEQRIGRIDRFGQQAKVVNIYNMVVADSIQETIYMRLLDRIGIFKGTIGDMEAILDAPFGNGLTIKDVYNQMEKEFFTKDLSEEVRQKKIREVERAVENEKEHLRHLKDGLSNSLTNDAYFQEEIKKILDNNAYVTAIELKNYIDYIIQHYLHTCTLNEIKTGEYEFILPLSQSSALRKFLTQYGDESSEENRINLSSFKRRIEGKNKFKLTFDQEKAYNDASLIYVNLYHPLILACLRYINTEDNKHQTTFSYSITSDDILSKGDLYYLGIYQIKSSRPYKKEIKDSYQLLPVLYNVNEHRIIDDQFVIDQVFKKSQINGAEKNAANIATNQDIIDDLMHEFAAFIKSERNRRIKECKMEEESDLQRNVVQTTEYYKARINEIENRINEYEIMINWISDDKERNKYRGNINRDKRRISDLEEELDERLKMLKEDTGMSISVQLLSVNFVTII